MAKQFQKANAGTYLAGLWEADFPLCLLWEAHAARTSTYRAPSWYVLPWVFSVLVSPLGKEEIPKDYSWGKLTLGLLRSWAAMDTSIPGGSLITESTFDSKASAPTTILAKVESVSCTTDSADPTGRVTGGYLTITGKIIEIVAKAPRERDEGSTLQGLYDWDARLAQVPRPLAWGNLLPNRREEKFTLGFHADTPLSSPGELACLLIGEIPSSRAPRALVLKMLSPGQYERVGLIDRVIFGSSVRSNDWMPLFDNAPTRTITMV